MHKCFDCKKEKPDKEFYKNWTRPNGLDVRCILCQKLRSKVYGKTRGAYWKKYMETNLFKKQARWKLQYAIKTGKIVRKPCEACGNIKSEAHHEDYNKPLEVRWLCHAHHMEIPIHFLYRQQP